MKQRLLYDSHIHTPLCLHATGEPEEYAEVAFRKGLKGIVITCHGPLPDEYSFDKRMSLKAFYSEYVPMVKRAKETYQGRLDIRIGLEVEYIPELDGWYRSEIPKMNLDYCMATPNHNFIGRGESELDRRAEYLAAQKELFRQHISAARTGVFDAVAHIDKIKLSDWNLWDLEAIMPDIQRCLDILAETGMIVELNTAGYKRIFAEPYPGLEILKEMRKRDIAVLPSSDAHVPHFVGRHFEKALDLMALAGYDEVFTFNGEGGYQSLPIDRAKGSLNYLEVPME